MNIEHDDKKRGEILEKIPFSHAYPAGPMIDAMEAYAEHRTKSLRDEIVRQDMRIAELEAENERLEAENDSAKNLCRFMASAWSDADDWIWEYAAELDAIMYYPIVQGSRNQLKLKQIGQQEYDIADIKPIVDALLNGRS